MESHPGERTARPDPTFFWNFSFILRIISRFQGKIPAFLYFFSKIARELLTSPFFV